MNKNKKSDEFAKAITSGIAGDLINSLLSRAGKSKDELIQILGREIGFALAAMLKEPLQQIVDSKSIQVTIELAEKKSLVKKKTKTTRAKKAKK